MAMMAMTTSSSMRVNPTGRTRPFSTFVFSISINEQTSACLPHEIFFETGSGFGSDSNVGRNKYNWSANEVAELSHTPREILTSATKPSQKTAKRHREI